MLKKGRDRREEKKGGKKGRDKGSCVLLLGRRLIVMGILRALCQSCHLVMSYFLFFIFIFIF